jgi:hypothetical protein
MKLNSFSTLTVAVACVGLVLPPMAFADQTIRQQHSPHPEPLFRACDVALRQGGLVVGQVLNPAGVPQAGAVVAIRYADHEIVRTTTDANGIFAARGLRGGQYYLMTENGQSICRFWAPDTAPPSAQSTALILSGQDVVRGQYAGPGHEWVEWIKCHPYITAGVVAAAIAIPIAMSDDIGSGS